MTLLRPLAIDKSFAQGINWKDLALLGTKRTFLVPSSFYHEVFRNNSEKRRRTLQGFGEFRRVDLPTFLRLETLYGKPVTEAKLKTLSFNPDALSPKWLLQPDQSSTVDNYQALVVEPERHFWEWVIDTGVIGFSEAEMSIVRRSDEDDFVSICETLRDLDRMRAIAIALSFKHAAIIDESWFHFRRFQALILQGLVLCHRYPNSKSARGKEFLMDLEHDVHDLQYLTLGLVAGSLATNETGKFKMAWRFKLLCPHGQLLTKASLSLAS